MDLEKLFAMSKRFKIGNSVNLNLCQLLLNIQMELETNPCDIWHQLNISDIPQSLKTWPHESRAAQKRPIWSAEKFILPGVELTYSRATGSVLTEPAAASSRMEMSGARESAH